MVEGFHLGFKAKVNRPKPSVQEYVKAIRDQQVTTDFHIDRLGHGKTPGKKRRLFYIFSVCILAIKILYSIYNYLIIILTIIYNLCINNHICVSIIQLKAKILQNLP